MTTDSETSQKFVDLKTETRKLFEQMRHIIQTQAMQVQTSARDIERIET